MKVVGLYKKDGVLKGFELEDDTSYSVAPQMLYLESNMKELIRDGYSYYDYDPTHITLPNGNPIMSLPELPIDDNVLVAIRMTTRASSQVLSDAEASRYYVNPTTEKEKIEFFKYTGEFMINTREELESYCTYIEGLINRCSSEYEVRPLNTLVNPDIWFTPEEVFGSEQGLYARLMNLRQWVNYEHFLSSCAFLISQGAMSEDDISARTFLKAWYSFGPDLLKGDVTRCAHRYDVDEDIICGSLNVPSISKPLMANRLRTPIVYNRNTGCIASSRGEVINADNYLSIENGARLPIWCEDSFIQRAQTSNATKPLFFRESGYVADVTDRFECDIEYNNYVFKYKADCMRTVLILSRNMRMNACPMAIGTITSSSKVNLADIKNQEGYAKYIVAQACIMNLAHNHTENPIGSYNAEYLKTLKMNPIGIICKYTSRKNPAKVQLPFLADWNNYSDSLTFALEEYTKPIPSYIYTAFNLSEDVVTKEDFLEKVDIGAYLAALYESYNMGDEEDGISTNSEVVDTYINPRMKREERISRLQFLMNQGFEHEPYNYYLFIKLVHDAITGRDIYGCLEEGKQRDAEINLTSATLWILAAVNCICQKDASFDDFMKVIKQIDDYVDMNKFLRVRRGAAIGYVRDFATDAELMFSRNNIYWCYVTKVFRELSNMPVDKQRPYLMEMLVFDNTNKQDVLVRDAFMSIVEEVLENNPIVPEYDYNVPFEAEDNTIATPAYLSKKFAGYFAIKLMFKCIVGMKNGRISQDTPYTERCILFKDKAVDITVPVELLKALASVNLDAHRKYVTTEYYCRAEVRRTYGNTISQFCCANAYITPWSVEALPGYAIRSYPFMYNYYDAGMLINSFGEEKVNSLVATNVKTIDSIRNRIAAGWVLQEDGAATKALLNVATSYADLEILMEEGQAETVEAYVKRWTLAKNEAKKRGKLLLSIPLKQDIMYDDIAEALGYKVTCEPVYTDDTTCKSNFLCENILPMNTQSTAFIMASEEKISKLERLNVSNISDNITKNIVKIMSLPVLDVVAYAGTLFNPATKNVVSTEYIHSNFYKVDETTYIARTEGGYYVYTE